MRNINRLPLTNIIKWLILALIAYWIYQSIRGIATQAQNPIDKVKDAISQISRIPQRLVLGQDSYSDNGMVYQDTPVLGNVYDPIFKWMEEHGYDTTKGIKLYQA